MKQARLIADVGGSNVRFALTGPTGRITDLWVRPGADYVSFDAALSAYLDALDGEIDITAAVIAAAGPVLNRSIALTNRSWTISADAIAARLGSAVEIQLLNDLEAVAHALPHLTEDTVTYIDHHPPLLEARARMLVVNVGTGFGSASLIRSGSGWVSCPSESGHMVFGATGRDELNLFRQISEHALTHEDVLSGPAVRRMASVFAATHGTSRIAPDFDLADDSQVARQTVERMAELLARACRNLTLASAAWDGVYLCGSVAKAWWQRADLAAFRRQFASDSKMQHLLDRTPIGLLSGDDPALIGLSKLPLSATALN
ncbi:MAG: glucokinase [Hyphomicrobiaceae bacterium]|nr:glucokinase [Hyphomicrobiaceae bacterium]